MSSLAVFLKTKKYYLGILLILVLATFLRVHNLTTQGLHISDEAAYLMEAWDARGGHAKPGHIFTLALSLLLFGLPDYSGLIVSAFFGILTVGLVFVLGKSLYNTNTGIVAAAWLAVSGYHIFFSRTVLAETVSVFFFTLGIYLYYLSRKKTKFSYLTLILSGLFSGLAFTFQYRLFLIPVFLGIFEIHFLFIEKKAKLNRKIKRLICLSISLITPLLLMQLATRWLQPSFTYFAQVKHMLFHTGVSAAGFSLSKPLGYLRFLWLFEGIPIFALTIFALGYHLKRTWPRFRIEDIIVVTPLLGPLLFFSLLPFQAPRVMVIILPFLALTVGRLSDIFVNDTHIFKNKRLAKDFLLLMAICVIVTVGISNSYRITQIHSGFQEAFAYLKDQGASKVITGRYEMGQLYLGIQNVKNMPLSMEELHRLYAEEGYRFLLQDYLIYSHYRKSAFEIEEGYRPVMEIENTFYRLPPILLGDDIIRDIEEVHWNYIKIYDLKKIFLQDEEFVQIIDLNFSEGKSESILQNEKGGIEIIPPLLRGIFVTRTVDLGVHPPKGVWISWKQDLSVKEDLKTWHKLNDEICYSQTKYPVVAYAIFDIRRDGVKMVIKQGDVTSFSLPAVTAILPRKEDEVGIVYHGVKVRGYPGNCILVRKDSISHGEKYSIRYKAFHITAIEIQTRTSPDGQRWSDWSEPYRYCAGEALKSPRNRYLQCKATLLSKDGEMTPILKGIKIKIKDLHSTRNYKK